jgi:redox-sensitive bicupin YhaK (pirin superfamily)
MITVRKSAERGHFKIDWLDSRHTFSFGEYYDPRFLGFSALRVINEDVVAPGAGFPTHPHRDMEIITYVLEGELEHRDSLGTGAVIRPGEVQRMSAGTGIRHSEFNPSEEKPTKLLQIWLLPDRKGVAPSYEQTAFPDEERRGKLRLVASPDGREGSVTIHQDTRLYATLLAPGTNVKHTLADKRVAWVQVARGDITVNGVALQAGDGAAISKEAVLDIAAQKDAEVLLFDMPSLQ